MNNGAFKHGSVRKNTAIRKPHGFDWESKCGSLPRVMHFKDALAGSRYGNITYYYRPISGSVNSLATSSGFIRSTFSPAELNTIEALKTEIPFSVISEFDVNYAAWKNTWSDPEIAICSNPRGYAESEGMDQGGEDIKEVIFTEDDIKSFHVSSGEIVFNDLTAGEIEKRINGEDSSLTYYLGDVQLFDSVWVVPMSSSLIYNDLAFVIVDARCYLLSGYPSLDKIGYNKEEHKQLREQNALKHQKSWDIFIRHLEEKGKMEK